MHRYFGNSILGDVSGAFSGFLLHEKQFSAYLSTAGEGGEALIHVYRGRSILHRCFEQTAIANHAY